jgi:alkyl sulfatase BDS1-like metallo-beta-lactamase superfamily hydrolase
MPVGLWLDYLGILLDSSKAEGLAFVVNLVLPDVDERYVLELSNSTLTNISGVQADRADLTLTINRTDLEPVMMQRTTFAAQAQAGLARFDGNPQVLEQLMGCLVPFDQYFEIMPGTKARPAAP